MRFAAAAAELLRTRGRVFLECGPGRTLCGAVQQAVGPGQQAAAVPSLPQGGHGGDALEFLLGAAGRLHVAGIALGPLAFEAGGRRAKLSLPGYPFARTRYALPIVGPDAGAPGEARAEPPQIVVPTAQIAPPKEPMVGYVLDVLHGLTGRTFASSDIEATFLELGLDSLVLMQLASRIKVDLNRELRFRSLLEEHTSVQALAQALQ